MGGIGPPAVYFYGNLFPRTGTLLRAEDLILVIDDDVRMAGSLAAFLGQSGYRVMTGASADQGLALASVHQPALILLDLSGEQVDAAEMCGRLGRDVLLKHIPVLVIVADEAPHDTVTELLGCIDDFIATPFDPEQLTTRIALALRRVRTMGGANPLTRLPGNVQIQEHIIDRLNNNESLGLLYIDLDNFKAFNDHYGFLRGDEAIKLLARCAREAVMNHSPANGFVGHIGGDDFAAIVPAALAEQVAHQITNSWDNLSPNLYEPEDATRGYIEIADRRGQLQRHPLATVSIGIATNREKPLHSHWHASELATEMKSVAKMREGSVVAIDRRREISLDDARESQPV